MNTDPQITVQFRAQSLHGSPQCTCHSIVRSKQDTIRIRRGAEKRAIAHLLVEDSITLVNVCDVALILVKAFARELVPLVLAK